MFAPFLVLAFGFGSPLMLWGLAIGGVPILIHLLHRRRYVEMPWAAMRFLLAATKRHARRMRLEQILLLLLRTAIMLLIALAFARPTAQTMGELLQGEGPRHRVVVVDATLSMGYSATGESRFEKAKSLAKKVISTARQGDAINLVRLGESTPRVIVRRPAFQVLSVLEEVEQLAVLDERVDVSTVLKEIEELLGAAPEITRKEVHFITDMQASTWAPGDPTEAARVRVGLKKLADRARLTFLDVGEPGAANVAVTGIRSDEGFVLSGRPARLTSTLKNFGTTGASGQLIELTVDDRLADTQRVDLPIGTDVRVDFAPVLTAGEHRLEVRLKPDGLTIDDTRRTIIPVRDELQVLLVNGKPSGEVMGNATDFLRLALAPQADSNQKGMASPIRPTIIREGELLGTDLSRYDCVFICNVAVLTEREAEVVRGYLESGGGVVFCLGDQVRADSYNSLLFKSPGAKGKGESSKASPKGDSFVETRLLPAKLLERVGDPRKKETAFEFDAGEFAHPIVRPFQGNPGSGLEQTKTFAYYKVQIPDDRGARVALQFSNGDPAIVEAPFGRGRAILITTSLDREWSTWAVWGHTLIPLTHEMVYFAVSGRATERDVLVGQVLSSRTPGRARDVSASLHGTGVDPQTATATADGHAIITEPVMKAGVHKLVIGPPVNRTDWFAVNVDTTESDLATIRQDDLKSDLLPGIEFQYQTDYEESSAGDEPRKAVVSTGTMFSRSLLTAALLLLLVEQLMAWQFNVGAFAFLTLTGLASAWWLGSGNVWLGIACVLLTAIALWRVFWVRK